MLWLLRHHENPPLHKVKGKTADDLVDRQLPELLFHMEEIRALIKKYSQVSYAVIGLGELNIIFSVLEPGCFSCPFIMLISHIPHSWNMP